MEHLSRVERYQDLRNKIENMDLYSYFETSNSDKENNKSKTKEIQLFNYDHIKKNTLSMSLNELMKEDKNKQSQAQEEKKKVKKEDFPASYRNIGKDKKFIIRLSLYITSGVLFLTAIILVILVSQGVF